MGALRARFRQAKAADMIRQHGAVTVDELVALFGVSQETVRRDLNTLIEAGVAQKVQGGAKAPRPRGEGPYRDRLVRNASAKRLIAEKAARMLSPGDSVLVDSGSTTLAFAEEMAKVGGLTVVTNSIGIARIIGGRSNRSSVFMLGGRYDTENEETLGPTTVAEIARFQVRHAVLTVAALDGGGAMDFNFEEAEVARAMVAAAERVTIIADASKLGARATFRVCGLDEIDCLITDSEPEPVLKAALAAARVQLL